MTPAVRLLKKQQIAFTLHQYHHDANAPSYGEEAAEKLNINTARVFKTLIVTTDKHTLVVAILPVNQQLNLKCLAKILKVKKVQMADAKRVQTSSGYVLGGISPIGQKKPLETIIDNSSLNFTTIFVSGGKRGLEIELSAKDLALIINAKFAKVI
jgi:Cys-tRNA(Pro)/Cys-tRNA(Cys) deacylase